MKGQSGLTGPERLGQITNALLAGPQPLDDVQPCFIRERVKQTRCLISISDSRNRHEIFLYQQLLISQVPK